MARTKYILVRPNDQGKEENEVRETISRMRGKNLQWTRSETVKRYGKHYNKLIFKTPENDKD